MSDLFRTILGGYQCFYYSILLLGSILCFLLVKRRHFQFFTFLVLLIATLLFELLTSILKVKKASNWIFIYSIFNAFEYSLFGLYFLMTSRRKKIQLWVMLSIMLFAINSFVVAYLVHKSQAQHMALFARNFNIEAFLLFMMFTYLLFTIDDLEVPIYKHPDFWISVGIIVFNGGLFIVFVLYPLLLHVDSGGEYGFIIKPLNLFLYISMIIGLVCSLRNRKYLIQ